jgi:hypothetical protein
MSRLGSEKNQAVAELSPHGSGKRRPQLRMEQDWDSHFDCSNSLEPPVSSTGGLSRCSNCCCRWRSKLKACRVGKFPMIVQTSADPESWLLTPNWG